MPLRGRVEGTGEGVADMMAGCWIGWGDGKRRMGRRGGLRGCGEGGMETRPHYSLVTRARNYGIF